MRETCDSCPMVLLRHRSTGWSRILLPLLLVLCASAACSSDTKSGGHGGATTSGGRTGTGGASGTGGVSSAGGLAGAGGGIGSGGVAGAGGVGSGGAVSNGGAGPGGSAGAGASGSAGTGGASSVDAAIDAGRDAVASVDLANVAVDVPVADTASFPGTNNPVLAGLFADPHIAVFDDTFYIYPTTDGFADWGATSFSVFSSTNLVRWTNRGVVLNLGADVKWATSHAWAPSTARVGDTYYYYFTADNQIGVATSKSPVGPFKDALAKPLITARQYGVVSIDPSVFVDDNGQAYLSFGNGGLRMAKLNTDMVSFAGTPTDITPAGTAGIVVEGSAMFKRKGTYYLQWSEGDTRQPTYKVAYARAQSPTGPFTRLAVILEQDPGIGILGPGGSTVLAIPSRDEYYIAYHRFKISGGDGTHRETCIDRLSFGSDGGIEPIRPTLQGLQMAVSP